MPIQKLAKSLKTLKSPVNGFDRYQCFFMKFSVHFQLAINKQILFHAMNPENNGDFCLRANIE